MKGEDEQIQKNEGGKPIRQYIAATMSNMSMFCFGLTAGWTSPIQPKLEDPEQTPLDEPITATDMSWIASLLLLAGIIAPFMGAVTVDRFGRKLTMIVSCVPFVGGWLMIALANTVALLYVARLLQSIGICIIFTANIIYVSEIATGVLGVYFKLQNIDETSVENLGWLPLLTLVIFMITYCLGIGPLVWTIAGEVFPAQIKTLATSITTSINYALAFLVTLSFNYIQETWGAFTAFWICCAVALLGIVFIWIVVPETKHKTLQEIEELLNRDVAAPLLSKE